MALKWSCDVWERFPTATSSVFNLEIKVQDKTNKTDLEKERMLYHKRQVSECGESF